MNKEEKSPWQKGHDDGFAGKPGPAFPTPASSWSERLYASGWSRGIGERATELARIKIAKEHVEELLAVVKMGHSLEHKLPPNETGVCRCSQCDFVRARKAVLDKINLTSI